ncbi:MAG TPA: hypothetical protein VJ140_20275 [Actinomycetota bacterium]|nr:hypothetical protein [Actinomycetota bacterium]
MLVVVGLLAIVRWGGLAVQPPPAPADDDTVPAARPPVSLVVRRYLWYLTLAISAGVGAGILAAGAGGRLAMRLLAVTAGPTAQGRITEADQVVGRISAEGTLGFIVFTGLFFGAASGAAYLLLRRWLPGGRTGGVAFGALLLVLAGTRLEPLRPGNPDFDLVGPGWVSVVAFAALVLFHGMLLAALAGRLSRAVPLLALTPRAIIAHVPLLLLALGSVALVAAIVGVAVVSASQVPAVAGVWRDRRLVTAGRVILSLVALAALPSFARAVTDILGRP